MEAFTTTKILYGDKSMIPYVAEKIAWIRSRRILCCTGIAMYTSIGNVGFSKLNNQ